VHDVKLLSNSKLDYCLNYYDLGVDLRKDYLLNCPWINYFLQQLAEDDDKKLVWWLGALVDENSALKQVCFLHDIKGDGGKTQFFKAFFNYLFPSLVIYPAKAFFDNLRFAAAEIETKRIICVDENKNPNLLFTEFMMRLTGGSPFTAEKKSIQKQYNVDPNCQALIISNDSLVMGDKHHYRNRLVKCNRVGTTIEPPEKGFCVEGSEGNVFKYNKKEMYEIYLSEMENFIKLYSLM
jgi:hypothetical protein